MLDETEVKSILLEFVEPNRNNPNDIISLDIKGWRFPHTRDHGQYAQPVCFWTGITCDPIDGSVTGLNLGNGLYVHQLLGMPGGPEEGVDDRHGDAGGVQRHVIEEQEQQQHDWDSYYENLFPKKRYFAPIDAIQQYYGHDNSNRRTQKNITTTNKVSNSNNNMSTTTYNISPSFPSSLGKLTSLRFVNLSHNRLQGSIPKSVLQLPNLEIIDVQGNDLTGTFPHFESDDIRVLDLSKNRFHGPLDSDIFGHPKIGPYTAPYLVSLVKFDVSHNGLNGTIPLDGTSGFYDPEVMIDESLQNLQYFDLGYNLFSGTIPNNFGNFYDLQGLFLEHNLLVGTIPKSLFRGSGFGVNPLPLVQLFLQQNLLSGTLNDGLAVLPNLRELYVDGNKLTGEVPEKLCASFLNSVFLNSTQAARGCDGICCPANSASKEGVAPCTPCPDDGGFHRYMGQHDTECREGMDEIQILDLFFDQTHGDEWLDSSYFWEKGSPACERSGVQCNDDGKVSKIILPSLGLRGTLTPELGNLRSLEALEIPNNDLTGFLPSDLKFAPLKSLHIHGNRMQGIVPTLLCIKEGVNGNGIGPPGTDFNLLWACENIVCPRGTYSSIGRAAIPENEEDDGIQCLPCYDNHAALYMGSDQCTDISIAGLQFRREDMYSGLVKAIPLVIVVMFLGVFSSKYRVKHLSSVTTSPNDNNDATNNDIDGAGASLCQRSLSLPLQRWMSSPVVEDEADAGDDWTAGYSDSEEVQPISESIELPRSNSRLPGVV